jgi:hypothetical protein
MRRARANLSLFALIVGLAVPSSERHVAADEQQSRPLDFLQNIFDPVAGRYVRADRVTSTMMISGQGTICSIDMTGRTSSPFRPFSGTNPVNFALASFDGSGSRPTAILAGNGGSGDLPMRVFGFGPPPALMGDIPMPGMGAGLLISTADLTGDPTQEILLSAPGSGTVHMVSLGSDDVFTFEPFPGYTGVVRTAAGDFDGNGVDEVAVSRADNNAEVKFFEFIGNTFRQVAHGTTFAIAPDGGVWMDGIDVNGDGVDEFLVAPGSGTAPVNIYNLVPPVPRIVGQFVAFDQPRGPIRIAAGYDEGTPVVIATSGPEVQAFTPPDAATLWGYWQKSRKFANPTPFGTDPLSQLFLDLFTPAAPQR